MNYIERLREFLDEENGGYIDYDNRVEPTLMVNGEVFYSGYGEHRRKGYESHTNMLCSLVKDDIIDLELQYDYGYHRTEYQVENEEVIECFAYGHVVHDHNGDMVVVWEYDTLKGFEDELWKAISKSDKKIEHFFIRDYESIDSLVDFESFCNGNY